MYNPVAAEAVEKEVERLLPNPVGYRMLIAMPKVQDKTEGGIFRTQELIKLEETASIAGYVVSQGPDCYKDPNRFPNGPWCKEGDWVVVRSYSGTRIDIRGQEYRLINDDSIEAVVPDPTEIRRAF